MRPALLLLLGVLPAAAQFESLSTTHDGSVLFFTTRLSQTGTNQPNHGKVFLVDSRGVRPLLVRERVVFPSDGYFAGAFTTNYYDIVGVSGAGDISALAITGVRECSGLTGGLCRFPDQSEIYDARGQKILTADGSAIVSRNGRWALIVEDGFNSAFGRARIADLKNGEVTDTVDVRSRAVAYNYGIADDGSALVSYYDGVYLWRSPEAMERISDQYAAPVQMAVDSSASTAAWLDNYDRLFVWRRGAAASQFAENVTDAVLSADGSVLLVRSSGGVSQCLVFRTGGSGHTQVTSEPEGIRTATLSGNGRVVWAVTNRGRLLNIQLSTGTTKEFIGPVPAVLGHDFQPSTNPGLEDYFASPGQPLTLEASVGPTDHFAVRVGELSAPILDTGNGTVTVQTPWEAIAATPFTPYQIEIIPEPPSGWMSGASLRLYSADPRFTAGAHQGFESAVDDAHPAHPGEIIHLYGTGFGPVNPPVATGRPAPITPLSTTTALDCGVEVDYTSPVPAAVLFSGLAPLTIGYYQVDVQLPTDLSPGTYQLRCFLPAADPQRLNPIFASVPVQQAFFDTRAAGTLY